jgi:hypothetical protein
MKGIGPVKPRKEAEAPDVAVARALEKREHDDGMPWSVSSLGGRAPYVLGARTFWSLADVELDAVTLTQILEPLAIHRTLVEKVFVPSIVLDEPEPLVDS